MAEVPASGDAVTRTARDGLAAVALETSEACGTLAVGVALADARCQVLGVVVTAAGQFDGARVIVAVVPACLFAVARTAWDGLALLALEALEAKRALCVGVALAAAGLEVLGVVVVAAGQCGEAGVHAREPAAVTPVGAVAVDVVQPLAC